MKKFTLILAAAALSLLSCNRQKKDAFVLQGTIEGGGNDSILVIGLDSRFDRCDTVRYTEGTFSWSFVPDTVTPLIFIMSDGSQYPVFAEKATHATFHVYADSVIVSGGTYNDIVTRFRQESIGDTSDSQAIARIDSVIQSDPFTEAAPYLIYEYMVRKWHCSQEAISRTVARMSGSMQDSPFLVTLTNAFVSDNKPTNIYLSDLSVTDSTGLSLKFQDMYQQDHMLVCVWASWHAGSVEARKAMTPLVERFKEYKLTLADISIDTNKDRWIQCLKQDSLEWESFNENGGWNSKIIRSTYVSEFPVYILFTGLKKVVKTSASLDDMVTYIEKTVPLKEDTKKKETKKTIKTVSPVKPSSTTAQKFKIPTQ